MTGDVLLSSMLFRYRDLPLGLKMPDSPESHIKTQIASNATNGVTGVNGHHSPRPPGDTPSPPSSNTIPYHLELPSGNSATRNKHVTVKGFLAALQKFASKTSVEVGERVHSLIIGLVSSSISIEEFHHKIQETTNHPLRPFVIPFLKSHLPILQTELIHYSRLAKQSPQQYLRQNEHVILDTSSHPGAENPFEIYQEIAKENGKRRSPSSRNGKLDLDYSDTNGDGPPPPKRHQPIPSPTLNSRTSPSAPTSLGLPPGLNIRLSEDAYRDREGRIDRYERIDRDFYRPFYGNMSREYSDDREMEEEWRNIHTMLNCIMGMVEKTKRALCILQHRSYTERAELPNWMRHQDTVVEHKKRPSDIVSHFKIAEDRVTEVRRRAEEAVNEVKRQAVAELQKAVCAAESKASELVAAERLKMERVLAEARRQAAEDAMAQVTHQEESTENCWNCGRKANETCSGCNVARYCGSFCQHKDWESHHRVCSPASPSTPPRTTADHRTPSPGSRTTPGMADVKPIKIDV